jgi:hypothetical protein
MILRLAAAGILFLAAATMIIAPSDARIRPLVALIAIGVVILLLDRPR